MAQLWTTVVGGTICINGKKARLVYVVISIYCIDMEKDEGKSIRVPPFMRKLCPTLSEEELEVATRNLIEYLEVAIQIHTRSHRNGSNNRHPTALTQNSTKVTINTRPVSKE